MFNIVQSFDGQQSTFEIVHPLSGLQATINATQGAALQSFKLSDQEIIGIPDGWRYLDCQASGLLFPFANRVQHGRYSWNNKTYQFRINDSINGHAIHGLVYDQAFELVNTEVSEQSASIQLAYFYEGSLEAFPFPFKLQVEYIFNLEKLMMHWTVENLAQQKLPYTWGWHPYFRILNKEQMKLSIHAQDMFKHDATRIACGKTGVTEKLYFNWMEELDQCYSLDDGVIRWDALGKEWSMQSAACNYVQLFSTPDIPYIAIELVSGPSNAFNSGEGLRSIDSKAFVTNSWQLTWKDSIH